MYNCPNCAGNLSFDIASQKLMCDYCKTQLDPYEYQKSQDAEENDMFGVTVYTCPQCGGEIMTTNVTAAGFCTYCGASTILDSRMSNEKRPARIIPFTHTKEDCRKSFRSLAGRALYAPRQYRDPEFLDRFRGIYIPYWVYSYKIDGNLRLSGSRSYRRGDYRITDHYRLSGQVDASYSGLTYDASSSFDDNVAETIAPFEAVRMKPFAPSFLCGFYADAPDVGSEVYEQDVLSSISEDSMARLSGVEEYRRAGVKMPDPDQFKKQLDGPSMQLRKEEPFCAYLPVWFLTYRKNDRVAYAVMNGSTGKIMADLPADEGKYLLGSLILAIPFFALLVFFFTMTGQMVLTLSSVLALISLFIYAAENASISDRETHKRDKGYHFADGAGQKDGSGQQKESGKNGKALFAFIRKNGPMALMILVFVILHFGIGLTGLLSQLLSGIFTVYGIVSVLVLAAALFAVINSARSEVAKKGMLLHIVGSVIAVAAAAGILIWNPVSDLWFYGASIAAGIGVCLTFMGIIRKYNILATRPLPTFYDRKGGNDRAK